MFLDVLKKKFDEVVDLVTNPETVVMVKGVVTDTLQTVKTGVNKAVDFAVDAINEIGNPSTAELDELHEKQREAFFDNLLETLVDNDPARATVYTRFVDWLKTVPYDNVTHYLALFQDGELTVNGNTGRIDCSDFFVPSGEYEIRYKPEHPYSNVQEICTSREVACRDEENAGNIYFCRVSMPNTGTHDERFPVLYMISKLGSKNEMRREYIRFIMKRSEDYQQDMEDHRNDPRNQKHTDWKANVQACQMPQN